MTRDGVAFVSTEGDDEAFALRYTEFLHALADDTLILKSATRRIGSRLRLPGEECRSTSRSGGPDRAFASVEPTSDAPNYTGDGFRSAKPPGASRDRPASSALAASSLATCSGVRFQPTAPRFWRSCSSLRAPMMTFATRRPLQQPVERDLRHGLAGLLRDLVERVDDPVEVLVGDRRPDVGRRPCSAGGWSPAAAGRGGSCR